MIRPRKNDKHLPPCVYEKHGAYWLVKKGKWERLAADLPTALMEYGLRIEGAAHAGGVPELADRVYRVHAARVSSATQDQYRYAVTIIKRKLKEFRVEQVHGNNIAAIKLSMADTPNMANRVLSFLRIMFTYAVEWQLVRDNPCIGIKPLPEAKRTRLLSASEWQAIYDCAAPVLRIVMRLQFLTGQRIGDVLSIRRSQLVESGIEFKQQKTGAKLLVRWSPDLRSVVDDALALHRNVPAMTLLIGKRGKPPGYRNTNLQWVAACAAARVEDARLNDARAMSATATRAQGLDATGLLGHASESMTKRYLRGRETPEVAGPSLRQALDGKRKGV